MRWVKKKDSKNTKSLKALGLVSKATAGIQPKVWRNS
jgi:hypothetical protein